MSLIFKIKTAINWETITKFLTYFIILEILENRDYFPMWNAWFQTLTLMNKIGTNRISRVSTNIYIKQWTKSLTMSSKRWFFEY